MPFSKNIATGLYELRVEQGSDICRYFYFFFIENRIIITHGFLKKSQKTPALEIDRAQRLKADYLRRHKNG